MKMPFGKFKGKEISQLDDDYLDWLLDIVTAGRLKDAVRNEIMVRKRVPANERILMDAIIDSGYRALSKKVHPDVGGKHEDMVALNRVVERLRRIIDKSV